MPNEFNVYKNGVNALQRESWEIICSSPPGGTDNRFKKCIFPRRTLYADNLRKGLRDEVDAIAFKNGYLLLAEFKPLLSNSLNSKNNLGESDYHKLKRLKKFFQPTTLRSYLRQGYGYQCKEVSHVECLLGVELIDCPIPEDIFVLSVDEKKVAIEGNNIPSILLSLRS